MENLKQGDISLSFHVPTWEGEAKAGGLAADVDWFSAYLAVIVSWAQFSLSVITDAMLDFCICMAGLQKWISVLQKEVVH